jgi:hypothetical protein
MRKRPERDIKSILEGALQANSDAIVLTAWRASAGSGRHVPRSPLVYYARAVYSR